MFHGTYDRGSTRMSPPNTLACPKALPTHFFGRITFASPKNIWPDPRRSCGHWSKRKSWRSPVARTCRPRLQPNHAN
jgi:hypothetical protein